MRGVILAGGKGTRLLPATKITNKHLIPIVNHPMILYPLHTLKNFGIKNILLISGGEHIGGFAEFLGDGSAYGVNLTYKVQKEAGGIAQALGLAKDFVCRDTHDPQFAVVLGDNILGNIPKPTPHNGATLFLKKVPDPQRFGVAVFKNKKLTGGHLSLSIRCL
jgi:glucose-1-phosphate thymidylyltransferase